jgi:hypothetical protein
MRNRRSNPSWTFAHAARHVGAVTGLACVMPWLAACAMEWDDPHEQLESARQDDADENPSQLAPSIAADALLWLDAARGSRLGEEGTVEVWADQSGSGHDAFALTPAQAPRLDERGERPVLEFDGLSELRLPQLPAFSELSFFAVARVHAAGADLRCASLLHLANATDTIFQKDYIDFRRQKQEFLYQVTTSRITVDPAAQGSFSTSALHLLNVVHRSDETVSLRLDGKVVGAASAPLPALEERGYNIIGHNHYHEDADTPQCDAFRGEIGELLLFSRALADDERAHLERQLAQRWGLRL